MLDNIIEKYGLDAVSKKTRISKKNLEKLLKKEFSSFSKPMALGFVSILEREYKYDFSSMKEDIVKWFEENGTANKNNVVFPPPEDENSKWIAILPIVAVAIFGFYLYQNEFVYQNNVDRTVKKEVVTDIEKNKTQTNEKSSTIFKPKDDANDSNISKEIVKNSIEENSTDISQEIEIKKEEKKSKSKDEAFVMPENIIIHPTKKIWIGVVNLKNWKRYTITTPNDHVIEADSNKLIITGHGFFSIDDLSGNNIKYDDRKKHFFILKDEKLVEVNESKFKKLNGGKIW